MIAEIQCLPDPAGNEVRPYAVIEAAIASLQGSGLVYEVGALGTTIEGPPNAVWEALRAAHEACLAAGAVRVVTVIKVAQNIAGGPTIAGLIGAYRGGEGRASSG